MLIAAGLPLPEHVFVHGFLLIGKDKMGKSAGNAIDPFEIMDEYGTDALRYYLMREVSFGHDGAVSVEGFRARYESELANDFGNLASRTIAMVHRYRDGVVPDARARRRSRGRDRRRDGEVCELLDRADLTGAGDAIWLRVRRLNRYVEERAPWTLAKDPDARRRARHGARLAGRGAARRRGRPASVDAREHRTSCSPRSASPQVELDCARMQAGRLGAIAKLEPLFPKP